MTKLPKYLTDTWPNLKSWPSNVGPMPTQQNINDAAVWCRAGVANHMACSMAMRTNGATRDEGAAAATAATGSTSVAHVNKLNQGLARKVFEYAKGADGKAKVLPSRAGQTVITIALKGKATKAVKAKGSKGKATAETTPAVEALVNEATG